VNYIDFRMHGAMIKKEIIDVYFIIQVRNKHQMVYSGVHTLRAVEDEYLTQ